MFSLISNFFNFDDIFHKLPIPKTKKIGPMELAALNNVVIKSEMYLHYYERPKPYKSFQLPGSQMLYFIRDSKLVHEIVAKETVEDNNFTTRKQRYKYNQSLLLNNPVASSSINSNGYLKDQHKLFVSLVMGIDSHLQNMTIPQQHSIIRGKESIKFIVGCVAQCYLPMLLNIEASRVPLILDDFCHLLNVLEVATGKHNITFGDYLDSEDCAYNNTYEQVYLPLFHKIVSQGKNLSSSLSAEEMTNPQFICKEIIQMLTSECNICKVLSSQFDLEKEAVNVVNNILSWMDNMLNVVHTILNFLVILSIQSSSSSSSSSSLSKEQMKGIFTKEFYRSQLPKARALATMFMRHVVSDFTAISSDGNELSFKANDILMMSNGNEDTVFGGHGRTCPSKPWSSLFMEKMIMKLIDRFEITRIHEEKKEMIKDPENDSWFWNKYSTENVLLIARKE